MNSLEYASPSLSLPKGSEKKPAYIAGAACLLLLWAVFSAMTALVAVAVFIPGHLGLSDWLRGLADLWPGDSPTFST
jgi:hypothetical protein